MLRMILVLVLYGIGTVLGLKSPALASSFFVWSDIFRPVDFARRTMEFPGTHVVTAVLVLSVFFRRSERRWTQTATMLLVLTGWVFVCSMTSPYRSLAMEGAFRSAKYLLPLVLVSWVLTTAPAQRIFLYTLAASVGLWSAQTAVVCLLRGVPLEHISIPGGQMTERNDFMVGAIAALPLIAYVGWAYEGRLQKWIRLAARGFLVLTVICVFLSKSRGAVVGLGLLFVYYVFATGRFGRKFMAASVLLAVALPLVPDFVAERMSTLEVSLEEQSEASASERLTMMRIAVDVAMDHPIVGVGNGAFPPISSSYGAPAPLEPHSIWLKSAAEYGFPMLILFVLFVVRLLRSVSAERKRAVAAGDRRTERMAIALQCSIVGFLAPASFTSQFLSEYFWAICALAGAFVAYRESEARKAAAAPVTIVPKQRNEEPQPSAMRV